MALQKKSDYAFTDICQYSYNGIDGMKPLAWIGSAKDDLLGFPGDVIREMGHALYLAQIGAKHAAAKPLKGFGGAGVLEIVEDFDGSTFRAVYTVKFAEVVFVLHAFQKKSKKGIATPKPEIEKVKARLRQAQEEYEAWKKRKP